MEMSFRKTWFWALSAFVAIVVTSLVAGVAASRSSAAAAQNGQIAWKSFINAGSTWSIYAANRDGSNIRRLTNPGSGRHDDLPSWSPDGSNVIFVRAFQPNTDTPTIADEIMRVNADGTGLRRIGTCTGRCLGNGDPQYSPDGHRIVYARLMHVKPDPTLVLGVWVMSSDGRNPRLLTHFGSSSEDHEPTWSPDGKNVVFTLINRTAAPVGQQALFVVASNGRGTPRRITPWSINAGGASWSPDGSKIVFQSYRDCSCTEVSQIYTMAPNGTHLTRLTGAGRNIEPDWSPDGKSIVYGHQPGVGANELSDLWTMDAHGKHNAPIVQTTLWESEPDWGS